MVSVPEPDSKAIHFFDFLTIVAVYQSIGRIARHGDGGVKIELIDGIKEEKIRIKIKYGHVLFDDLVGRQNARA